MGDEKVLEYSNGEITVIWKPDVCIHAGECVKGSPDVFQPKERPWIQIERRSSEKVMETIDKCPSGALSYRVEKAAPPESKDGESFRIRATQNGPFLVKGNLEIEDEDGNITVCDGKTTALCRCGASAVKPYCDGSHKKVGFYG